MTNFECLWYLSTPPPVRLWIEYEKLSCYRIQEESGRG